MAELEFESILDVIARDIAARRSWNQLSEAVGYLRPETLYRDPREVRIARVDYCKKSIRETSRDTAVHYMPRSRSSSLLDRAQNGDRQARLLLLRGYHEVIMGRHHELLTWKVISHRLDRSGDAARMLGTVPSNASTEFFGRSHESR